MERTLGIVKPDAVSKNLVGPVLAKANEAGLRIVAIKMLKLSKTLAEGFYYVHKERPFFNSLTDFMSSGPIVVLLLEREDAISKLREVMGATDPAKADRCTIRKEFGLSLEKNSIHGSDAQETADFEISYFFSGVERLG